MKQTSIKPVFVDIIPDRLEDGVLYICERYKTATHKCCCGCGEEAVTPLTPADWSVRKTGKAVSLIPSIGNWSFACKSHYYIQKNQIIWAAKFSQRQIDQVRLRDASDKKAYIAAINKQKSIIARISSLVAKFWNSIIHWWK